MTGIEPVYEKGYPCWEAVNRGATMADANQLEMKIHEQNDKISKLNYELNKISEQLEKTQATLLNLCERLMLQG